MTFTERCCDIMETGNYAVKRKGLAKKGLSKPVGIKVLRYCSLDVARSSEAGCEASASLPGKPDWIGYRCQGVVSCEKTGKDIRVMVRAFTFRGFPVVDGDRFVHVSAIASLG